MTDLSQLDADLARLGPLTTFPWHLQQQFALAASTDKVIVLGGNQCLGGEQELYDPVAQVSRRIDSITEPFHVWAWDGSRLVMAEAGVPFPKDVGLLNRYELSNGESFVASPTHRVLCADGQYHSLAEVEAERPRLHGDLWVMGHVQALRADTKWDVTVPVHHNYWCAGVIHHNSGKSTVGAGIVSRLIRREGPIYKRLMASNRPISGRAMKIWVAPTTLEKFESNWENRLLHEAFAGIEYDYVRSPFRVIRWHDSVTRKLGLPPNELWCKSHDQGWQAFESDVVDLVLFDEEPKDKRLVTSAAQRGSTINGILIFTFTPLNGMSYTHTDYYLPTVKEAHKVTDRVWKRGRSITLIQMGMADNPEAVAGGGVARLRDNPTMTEAEKRTRLYGDYGYTEGLIYPELAGLTTEADDIHLLEALPPSPMSWVLAADPNKAHGAAFIALDPYGNYFLADEHYADNLPDSQHFAAYHAILERWKVRVEDVLFGADPGGAGAQAILNAADFDLPFQAVQKDAGSVSASIKLLRRLLWVDPQHVHPVTGKLGAPRFYFLRSVRSRWMEDGVEHFESRALYELRQYRQKPNAPPDTPVKERDHVVDPIRYTLLMRPWSPEAEDPAQTELQKSRETLDPLSRKMDDEFEQMVVAAAKHKKRGTDFSAR